MCNSKPNKERDIEHLFMIFGVMEKRGFVVSSLKRGYEKTGFCSLEPQVITEGLKNGVL